MSGNMMERVARKLCAFEGHDPDATFVDRFGRAVAGWPWWREYVDPARAAIEAMREPSEAMKTHAACAWHALSEAPEPMDLGDYCGAIYTAHIDAALEDPE